MVDLTQTLLIIVITVLTILLSFIGIQVVFILREVRRSLEKVNKMLDDFGLITESIAHPIAGLGGVIDGLKSGIKTVETFGKLLSKKKKKNEKAQTCFLTKLNNRTRPTRVASEAIAAKTPTIPSMVTAETSLAEYVALYAIRSPLHIVAVRRYALTYSS